MLKRSQISLTRLIAVLSFIVAIIFGIWYMLFLVRLDKNHTLLNKSIELFKEGRYEEGFRICSQGYYDIYSSCYIEALIYKAKRNDTITKEFCDNIPIPKHLPFASREREEKGNDEIVKLRSQCIGYISEV